MNGRRADGVADFLESRLAELEQKYQNDDRKIRYQDIYVAHYRPERYVFADMR